MAQEAAASAAETATAATADEGSKPAGADEGSKVEPKTFDEAYVKQLRREAASTRTELNDTKSKLQELLDRDKTEQERLTETATREKTRADEAERRALRYEVASEVGLDHDALEFLSGSTREEMTASATKLSKLITERKQAAEKAGGFDGGARERVAEKGSPEQEHNRLLLAALGRVPNP